MVTGNRSYQGMVWGVMLALGVGMGCGSGGGGDEPVEKIELSGALEKGPFVLGSTIEVAPVDDQGNPSGQVFNTQTNNDLGHFAVSFEASGAVALSGSGFYYNEATGGLSGANLTLRAYYAIDAGGQQEAYLNLLTHLTYNRIKTLMTEGTEPAAAAAQAEQELYAALPIGPADAAFDRSAIEMSLQTGDTDANAYLFAASAVFAQAGLLRSPGSPDAGLQEIINMVAQDLADDGQLDASAVELLREAQQVPAWIGISDGPGYLLPDEVMQQLAERFDTLGSDAAVPDLNRILDQDFDGVVNAEDNCWYIANPDQDATACDPVWVDPDTGLMWENPNLDHALTEAGADAAFAYCDELVLAGYDDWYLPNLGELRSLLAGCAELETGGDCPATDVCAECGVAEACLTEDCFSDSCLRDDQSCPPDAGPGHGAAYWKAGLVGPCDQVGCAYRAASYQIEAYLGVDYSAPALPVLGLHRSAPLRCVRGGTPTPPVPECPAGQHWHGGEQQCVSNCDAGSYWDDELEQCIPECGPGHHFDADQMQCVEDGCEPGTHWDDELEQCVEDGCEPGSHWDEGTGQCVANDCPPGMRWDAAQGRCVIAECAPGTHWDEAQQQCVEDGCDPGSHWDDEQQQCVPNDCPSGWHWSEEEGSCVPAECPDGQHWDAEQQQCVDHDCPAGTHWDPVEYGCVPDDCGPGNHWDDEVHGCVEDNCPEGQHWDDAQQQCVDDNCPDGTHWDEIEGQCVEDQPAGDCAACPDFDHQYHKVAQQGASCEQLIADYGEPAPFYLVVFDAGACGFLVASEDNAQSQVYAEFQGCTIDELMLNGYNHPEARLSGNADTGQLTMSTRWDCIFIFE